MHFLLNFLLFVSSGLSMKLPDDLQNKLTPFSAISPKAFYINGGREVDYNPEERLEPNDKETAFELAIKQNKLWVIIKFLRDLEFMKDKNHFQSVKGIDDFLIKKSEEKSGCELFFMKEFKSLQENISKNIMKKKGIYTSFR